jgi:hypothetical protein
VTGFEEMEILEMTLKEIKKQLIEGVAKIREGLKQIQAAINNLWS